VQFRLFIKIWEKKLIHRASWSAQMVLWENATCTLFALIILACFCSDVIPLNFFCLFLTIHVIVKYTIIFALPILIFGLIFSTFQHSGQRASKLLRLNWNYSAVRIFWWPTWVIFETKAFIPWTYHHCRSAPETKRSRYLIFNFRRSFRTRLPFYLIWCPFLFPKCRRPT
jgi:hypothetical protein